ncbi:hypothetical protein [Allorhodopirellula solitaria]|uniref:Uncharacterized protein n=1 Tax=Allorhodopirellula solitaria TaxID=2527987 RepID=A0A5C5X0T9_9BACT|nr:hypothetical protein [Allorhodopirellula solitaria]TWT56607.1 hypothetical protein CA85_41410 [Allorhodopirellula solitaria]
MEAPEVHRVGISSDAAQSEPVIGSLLPSPGDDGVGVVGVVGSSAIRSPKQHSHGFLGVVPVASQRVINNWRI